MEEKPNINYINELAGDDIAFKKQLITVIKHEFPTEIKTYFENLEKEDYKKVASDVHKIKHKISILGLEKSYNFAVDYEDNLKEGNPSLKDGFNAILQNITEFLNKL